VGGKSRLLSFVSMMAKKKVGKETAVPIYDNQQFQIDLFIGNFSL